MMMSGAKWLCVHQYYLEVDKERKYIYEDGAYYDYSGYNVAILGNTALFGVPATWAAENGQSAYVVNLFVPC